MTKTFEYGRLFLNDDDEWFLEHELISGETTMSKVEVQESMLGAIIELKKDGWELVCSAQGEGFILKR